MATPRGRGGRGNGVSAIKRIVKAAPACIRNIERVAGVRERRYGPNRPAKKSQSPLPAALVESCPEQELVGFNYQADYVSLALVHAKYGKLPDRSTDDPSVSSAT
jgi:hypothetical protein